jgi:hypothetical protein
MGVRMSKGGSWLNKGNREELHMTRDPDLYV